MRVTTKKNLEMNIQYGGNGVNAKILTLVHTSLIKVFLLLLFD